MMNNARLKHLLAQYHLGRCTADQLEELDQWYHGLKGGREDYERWLNESGGEEQLKSDLYQRFTQKVNHKKTTRKYVVYSGAAAMLLLLSIGYLFLPSFKNEAKPMINAKVVHKAGQPGDNRAILTLADGSKVNLDDTQQGMIASQWGIKIQKTALGKLVYRAENGAVNQGAVAYNIVTTPRAGQYQIVLPDGTSVWMNAESTLRYPVKFNGTERRVELTGEAYFEVAHNPAMPFKVVSGEQLVTVLGTHFNIKAYADEEKMATTLLEGSVNIADKLSKQTRTLIPGKQAIVVKENGNIRLATADLDQAVAWKNGYFIFDNQDIHSIMKVISRWYDVDLTYHLNKSVRFGGTFSKSSNLEQLLKSFAILGNVQFDLKGRRIIISD